MVHGACFGHLGQIQMRLRHSRFDFVRWNRFLYCSYPWSSQAWLCGKHIRFSGRSCEYWPFDISTLGNWAQIGTPFVEHRDAML